MRRDYPPVWIGILLVLAAVMWRMMGAPLSAAEWADVKTPLWQAKTLAPSRMGRIFRLWAPGSALESRDLLMEGDDPEEAELVRRNSTDQPEIVVYTSAGLKKMPLESYVCGVVAAEMPASYHLEALKAQTVAARTRAVRQMESGGCRSHPEADICGDSGCCQGYASLSECREKWGNETDLYRRRIMGAVEDTLGQLLTYEGELITVMYHAMSGGRTEDAAAVFSASLPYLTSVESRGEEGARGFFTETTFSYEDMTKALNAAFPGLETTPEELKRSFSIARYTDSGRVAEVSVDGKTVQASALRKALGLRSTWFSITSDGEGITFQQRGYGHGVGMSQVGANSMAASGSGYGDILRHYYPGVEIVARE